MVSLTARTVNGVLTSPLTGGKAGRSALATAAGPAAGRYARHRATVRWRGGGGRHEAIWSDRGARRAAGPVRRGGDGPAARRAPRSLQIASWRSGEHTP